MSSPISIQALSLLKAIITERSLSRAEENLCISRSTANRMMHGLRTHFGDPLYMRTREGLSPTHAALTLLPYIQRLERSYHQIVSIKPFDPATSTSEVTVGLLGDDSDCLVSELIDLVRLNAPHVTLKFIHISEDRFEMLREGRLDFVISSLPGSIGKPFHTLPLASSRFVLVCSPEHRAEMGEIIAGLALETPVSMADAGEVRQESVASGLSAMPQGFEFTAIHDAARPLILTDTIERSVAVLRADTSLSGSLVSKRVTDTLKLVENGIVVSTPDRSFYWAAQTPQTFRTRALRAAYSNAAFEDFIGTDDASLVERAGGRVRCIEQASPNLKVTFPEDLAFAETVMRTRGEEGAVVCG